MSLEVRIVRAIPGSYAVSKRIYGTEARVVFGPGSNYTNSLLSTQAPGINHANSCCAAAGSISSTGQPIVLAKPLARPVAYSLVAHHSVTFLRSPIPGWRISPTPMWNSNTVICSAAAAHKMPFQLLLHLSKSELGLPSSRYHV
jgi:hypothetical protein